MGGGAEAVAFIMVEVAQLPALLENSYLQGWANAGSALSIRDNPNASRIDKLIAKVYLDLWVSSNLVLSPALYVLAAYVIKENVEMAQPVGYNASNIWELMKLGMEHADHAYITGEGLQSLEDDPSVQAAENNIVDQIRNLPGYGEHDFSISTSDKFSHTFTADGPSRDFLIGLLNGNPAFLMVHTATLYATNTTVSANRTISTTWEVKDQFDYQPAWNDHTTRSGKNYYEYNLGAMVSWPIYYGMLHAEREVPDTAKWNQTIPPPPMNSCQRCR